MKAIILVAGYATRLYPLTENMPKALLPVGGKTIIDYIVDEVNTIDDITDIYVVSNHKFADHFEKWSKERKNVKNIEVLDDGTETEATRRGAIGDIYFVIKEKNIDDDIVVIAGDNFFTYKLKSYYNYFKKVNSDCVCVKQFDDKEMIKQLGVALLDENNKVIDLEEKPSCPKSDKAVFATYMYKKDTVPFFEKYIEEGNKQDAPGYFIQWLYKISDIFAYEMEGDCFDIGTHEAYEEIKRKFPEK